MKYFSPGRVNLIGDHTDYNGGMVFPAALSMGTFLTVTEDDVDAHQCKFTSSNDDRAFLLTEEQLQQRQQAWVDYPLGVLKEFADRGHRVAGWHFHYEGNLPIGAALSSSASIEMVTAFALNALNGEPFTRLQLVQMAQHAENTFVGMNCGIMDQFASGFGKKNHAIALDCQSLNYTWVPLDMKGLKFVITNTNKPHQLVDSAYNQRRAECQQAFEILRRECDAPALCLYTQEQFDALAHLLSGNVLKRARHAVSEHGRVVRAVQALQQGNMPLFGQLMNESHASLRDDYEVTCPELDFLADTAQHFDGVLGSRMTGAGFGGCTVTLIADDRVNDFVHTLSNTYSQRFNLPATCYIANIDDGARSL